MSMINSRVTRRVLAWAPLFSFRVFLSPKQPSDHLSSARKELSCLLAVEQAYERNGME